MLIQKFTEKYIWTAKHLEAVAIFNFDIIKNQPFRVPKFSGLFLNVKYAIFFLIPISGVFLIPKTTILKQTKISFKHEILTQM